ncbi:hypothetical protein Q5O89_12815 [Peribacillus frigoritolerans]|nr:hypothetical protein [Peribacillus frigoritolerans]
MIVFDKIMEPLRSPFLKR